MAHQCNGDLEKGIGCVKYNGSNDHVARVMNRNLVRAARLESRTVVDRWVVVMNIHLQNSHGLSYNQAEEVIHSEVSVK